MYCITKSQLVWFIFVDDEVASHLYPSLVGSMVCGGGWKISYSVNGWCTKKDGMFGVFLGLPIS